MSGRDEPSRLFLYDAEVRSIALHAALADHDAAGVVDAAHAMSGPSTNVGATGLARLGATLSSHGADGDLAAGAALLGAVEDKLGQVREALTPAASAGVTR